ncbi:MAG: dockerin type I repeat-containing protein, partial [Clostridia bacterium]|nr:dockerin type I repeat-containing protein [Clostridia bacterium]
NVTGDLVVTAQYEEAEVPPTVLIGDVNCDGVVTASDISSLFAYVMNAGSLSEQALLNADIDGNGTVDATDASLLAQMVFGA